MTKIEITMQPIVSKYGYPSIDVCFNQIKTNLTLSETKKFNFDIVEDTNFLHITFKNKKDKDPDQAVIIKELKVAGFQDAKILQQCKYFPIYPQPWASQQMQKGIELKDCLNGSTYMGWNGEWQLEIDKPLFTWLHQTLSLGWIYPSSQFELTT